MTPEPRDAAGSSARVPPAPESAPLRGRAAEARSNDDAVLAAAREVFAERGFDAPMSEIAQRAGVGVASIYRRYPSKERLTLDLRLLALRQVIDIARGVASSEEPFAVRAFLERHLRAAASPLVTTFGRYVERDLEVDRAADELHAALSALIDHDLRAGLLPAGYGPGELMIATTHLRPAVPTSRERAIELHLRQLDHYLLGLELSLAHPERVRGTPLSWEEWVDLNSAD